MHEKTNDHTACIDKADIDNLLDDTFDIGGAKLKSRFFIGTAMYDSPLDMQLSIDSAESQVVTISLRRQSAAGGMKDNENFFDFIQSFQSSNRFLLPNTAGCHSAKEAITTSLMARELFKTNWIKLEVIGDDYTLQPDPFELVEAASELISQGFHVFPYCTDDLVLCEKLLSVGCKILMPWGAPIGTGKGLMNPYALGLLRDRFPNIPLIVDAGIGKPSHAAQAMEMGFDAVLLNTAVAKSQNSILMAEAFKLAIESGRKAYLAGCMSEQNKASASTPIIGTPFWHNN
jgi:thiazole synthase